MCYIFIDVYHTCYIVPNKVAGGVRAPPACRDINSNRESKPMSTTLKSIAQKCRQKTPKLPAASRLPAKSSTSAKMTPPKNGASVPPRSAHGSKASENLEASTSKKSNRSSRKPGSKFYRQGFSRPAVVRFAKIAEMIGANEPVNCTTIAERFEVCTKTAHRDLEYLQDQLGMVLEYDQVHHVYRLVDCPPSVTAFLKLITPEQTALRRKRANWIGGLS